ncbi:lectin-like domain-containing protein, partial [Oenococcus oeni]|uniref:lectin-like domain-containing protein n=4 Tax=Oenococcus oeni TaxID=1247 RepID=UPI0015D66623
SSAATSSSSTASSATSSAATSSSSTASSATSSAATSSSSTASSATSSAATSSSSTASSATSSAAKTTQLSYQDVVSELASSDDLASAMTTVTKENFLDYFTLNGSATYNATTGIVTLTTDSNNEVGNFSLDSEIDMNSSFTLIGEVNLGSKTSSEGGADGIGLAFDSGNTTDIGNSGGNLGIGGLQDALGFKLDTWHNDYQTPQADEPGAEVSPTDSNGFGWSADPDDPQFGAFVTTSDEQIQAADGNYYQRWWATTDLSSVQALSSDDLDGQFHDFVINYDGTTRTLTISYTETDGNVLTWSTTVSDAYQAMAMVVSASTGGASNLQQFEITSFTFQQAATVNVEYVDTEGNVIANGEVSYPDGADVNGTYKTTQLTIPNYTFVKMDDGSVTGTTSLPQNGTLTQSGNNGTVIYVYAPAYTVSSTKTVNETINYVDQNGKTVANSYKATPITFITVTNPVDGAETVYYSTTATSAELNPETGVPEGSDWTQANSDDFASVTNPTVAGYSVISNNAPASDLAHVASQTVTNTSDDLNYTVVYAPAYTVSSTKT